MILETHYNQLYQHACHEIGMNHYELDALMDDPNDKRYGITLLLRPNAETNERIQRFVEALRHIEPHQYYYPASDTHVTVLSIISCYTGFDLSQIKLEDYVDVIQKSLQTCSPFTIQFKGITASPSCLMIQGFPENDTLENMRDNVRQKIKDSHLQQSIDKRYTIHTAHATICRFRSPLTNTAELLTIMELYRTYNFGTCTIDHIDLVYNDWYQRKSQVKTLAQFNL